ncbi:hypothetical protein [Hymenobacter volaticus]|uniref:LPXTG cell wall anchor domain-containing protein n=1 Tax=Hymenobacter volaticus TaxID=2932254 RepID=A0ABY4G9R8_9BACT|nr:hypothetical protein [Hymenobacter volaticus]UOQ67665.1 hypothetical protein MUN86_07330 [Hymenobacter volaticus]
MALTGVGLLAGAALLLVLQRQQRRKQQTFPSTDYVSSRRFATGSKK